MPKTKTAPPPVPPPPTKEERRIIGDFTPRELTEDEVGKIFTLAAMACDVSLAFNSLVPKGRERSKALQHLRAAAMWAAEGIAKAPIQYKVHTPPEPHAKPKGRKRTPPTPPVEAPRMDPDPPVHPGNRRTRRPRGDG